MNAMSNRFFEAERLFLRSCLETAPSGGNLRTFAARRGGASARTPQLHMLKQRLLHAAMKEPAPPQMLRQLCGAANAAAEMVWNTECPLLLFPCLFEELAAAIPQPPAPMALDAQEAAEAPARTESGWNPEPLNAGYVPANLRPSARPAPAPGMLAWSAA